MVDFNLSLFFFLTKGLTHPEILINADKLPSPTSSKVVLLPPAWSQQRAVVGRSVALLALLVLSSLFLSVGPLISPPFTRCCFRLQNFPLSSLSIFVYLGLGEDGWGRHWEGIAGVFGVIEATETDSEKPIMSPPSLFSTDTDQISFSPAGLVFLWFIGHLSWYLRDCLVHFPHYSPPYTFGLNESN